MSNEGYTIKEMVDRMEKRMHDRFDELSAKADQTNGRVRELEKWRAYLTGAVALALAIGIPNLINIFA